MNFNISSIIQPNTKSCRDISSLFIKCTFQNLTQSFKMAKPDHVNYSIAIKHDSHGFTQSHLLVCLRGPNQRLVFIHAYFWSAVICIYSLRFITSK